jgi:AcrR family transcriptional regulator
MARPTTSTQAQAAVPTHRLTADERRGEIVEAAVKAFASGGLAGTSTEEIARLAGVSQPYLFRLFGTKRELFLAAVERSFDRVADGFTAAAATPALDGEALGMNPVLLAVARSYHQLLKDPSLLRLQLHSFAACDDPVVRACVRARFAGLVRLVADLSHTPAEQLRDFFAEGMLLNVAAAMELTDADAAWQRICDGGTA